MKALLAIPVLLGIAISASAQKAAVPSTKYTDPVHGVSFTYPSNWTSKGLAFYGQEALLFSPDGNDLNTVVMVGWMDKTGKKDQPIAGGISFEYAILPDKTPEACRQHVVQWKGQSDNPDGGVLDVVTIHGVPFDHVETDNAGLGNSWSYEVFTTFLGGACYGFEEGRNGTYAAGYVSSKADDAASAALPKVMQTVRIASAQKAAVPLTKYTDPAHGVSFTYPSNWQRVTAERERSSALLIVAGYKPPVVFQFTGAGTRFANPRFEALDFIYIVVKATSQAACARKVHDLGEFQGTKIINGRQFFHTGESDGSASQFIEDHLFGTYVNGACYMFEQSFNYNDVNGALSDADMDFLRHELNMVMQSVRISSGNAVALSAHIPELSLR